MNVQDIVECMPWSLADCGLAVNLRRAFKYSSAPTHIIVLHYSFPGRCWLVPLDGQSEAEAQALADQLADLIKATRALARA